MSLYSRDREDKSKGTTHTYPCELRAVVALNYTLLLVSLSLSWQTWTPCPKATIQTVNVHVGIGPLNALGFLRHSRNCSVFVFLWSALMTFWSADLCAVVQLINRTSEQNLRICSIVYTEGQIWANTYRNRNNYWGWNQSSALVLENTKALNYDLD